jgi:hypothetical protein
MSGVRRLRPVSARGRSSRLDLRPLLAVPPALRRTTRPVFGRIRTGYRRQGCDHFLHGANAAVMGAMRGRLVADVGRLAGEEETLLERMGQVCPCRSIPRKRMAVGSSHIGHSTPARGRQADEGYGSRPTRIGLIGCVREAGRRTHFLNYWPLDRQGSPRSRGRPKGRMW